MSSTDSHPRRVSLPSTVRPTGIPLHLSSRPLPPCPIVTRISLSPSFSSRQPLPSSLAPPASLDAPTFVNSRSLLPGPVTAKNGISRSKERISVERGAVPPLISLTAGLAAISNGQPRAVLLFIAAGTVILGIYFVPSKAGETTHPAMSSFLRRLPDVLTAAGCALIVLGIGVAFPNEIALVPLFLFISFAALALLFGAILAVWVTASLYGAAFFSLVTFIVVALMA